MLLNEAGILSPEIWIACMASLILVIDVFLPKNNKGLTYVLTQLSLIVAMILSARLLGAGTQIGFYNHFVLDELGTLLKLCIYIFAFFVFMYSKTYNQERDVHSGEYYVLCLFSILGMMILISSRSFLSLYLGLELFALPIYALVAFVKRQTGVDHIRFLHHADDAAKAIEGLKAWLAREGGVKWRADLDWLKADGAKIAWAQWRILKPQANLITRYCFDEAVEAINGCHLYMPDHGWIVVMNALGERVRALRSDRVK